VVYQKIKEKIANFLLTKHSSYEKKKITCVHSNNSMADEITIFVEHKLLISFNKFIIPFLSSLIDGTTDV
jgi:hypothetical protein